MKSVQVVGGPEDGRWIAMEDDSDTLVYAEPTGSVSEWAWAPDPSKAGPMPTYREVRYRVVERRAYHPGLVPK